MKKLLPILLIILILGIALYYYAIYYAVGNKVQANSNRVEDINLALKTDLTEGDINGLYTAISNKPDSLGFKQKDVIVQIDSMTFQAIKNRMDFKTDWTVFYGSFPKLRIPISSRIPNWDTEIDLLLTELKWEDVEKGYSKIIQNSPDSLFIFLIIPDHKLMRYKLYTKEPAA